MQVNITNTLIAFVFQFPIARIRVKRFIYSIINRTLYGFRINNNSGCIDQINFNFPIMKADYSIKSRAWINGLKIKLVEGVNDEDESEELIFEQEKK